MVSDTTRLGRAHLSRRRDLLEILVEDDDWLDGQPIMPDDYKLASASGTGSNSRLAYRAGHGQIQPWSKPWKSCQPGSDLPRIAVDDMRFTSHGSIQDSFSYLDQKRNELSEVRKLSVRKELTQVGSCTHLSRVAVTLSQTTVRLRM